MKTKGFTLLEILVAAGLLAILAVVAGWGWRTQLEKARDAKRKGDLNEMSVALRNYYEDNGCYPRPEVVTCRSTDLAPYLIEVPCDPINSGSHVYSYQSLRCNSFVIFVSLEASSDKAIDQSGCRAGCGENGKYNFYASSGNVDVGNSSTGAEGYLPTCPSDQAPADQRYCFAGECSTCCPGQGFRCSHGGTRCLVDPSCNKPTP